MDITRVDRDTHLELQLTGRFDAAWSEHVSNAIEAAVRAGAHHIALNFSGVVYLSSLGIGVLLRHYQALKAVRGSLSIIEPTESTLTVIRSAGLAKYLLESPRAAAPEPGHAPIRRFEKGTTSFEVYEQAAGARLTGAVIGQPGKLVGGGFTASDCTAIDLPAGTLALGLGAFGEGFADCRPRFGEFLAAAGAAIALPTAEEGVPDFVVSRGQLVPRVQTLYALTATGAFSTMIRFDARPDGPGMIGISSLVGETMDIVGTDTVGFAILAEAAGVVGATLRRSPAEAAGASPLVFPGVRDWLSFTTERSHERQLVFITGMATTRVAPGQAPFFRPIGPGSTVQAHLHGAVFPYRPVQQGPLVLQATVTDLLGAAIPRTVLHVMADTRPFEGVGETDLMRGACWIGPLSFGGVAS